LLFWPNQYSHAAKGLGLWLLLVSHSGSHWILKGLSFLICGLCDSSAAGYCYTATAKLRDNNIIPVATLFPVLTPGSLVAHFLPKPSFPHLCDHLTITITFTLSFLHTCPNLLFLTLTIFLHMLSQFMLPLTTNFLFHNLIPLAFLESSSSPSSSDAPTTTSTPTFDDTTSPHELTPDSTLAQPAMTLYPGLLAASSSPTFAITTYHHSLHHPCACGGAMELGYQSYEARKLQAQVVLASICYVF